MKKLVLLMVLSLSSSVLAVDQTSASNYGIAVQVTGSKLVYAGGGAYQDLYVIVDGTKYELRGLMGAGKSLLKPGAYRAKVSHDRHKNEFEVWLSYEFLLPDSSKRTFDVVGVGELIAEPH